MSTITSQLGTVSFQGHDLTVITTASGEHLVAMKPICEAIGLQWEAQLKRIKRHPRSGYLHVRHGHSDARRRSAP